MMTKHLLCGVAIIALAHSAAGAAPIDDPLFLQTTFSSNLGNDGWSTSGDGVLGANDPDGQSGMKLGWTGQNTSAQVATGVTIAADTTYYYQADFRLERSFNDGNWADGTYQNRDISMILRDASNTNIFNQTVTISAAQSETTWVTARFEFAPGDLAVGTPITIRFYKGTYGGGKEAPWADNVEFGRIIPEPGTLALAGLGGAIALVRRRRVQS